ILYRGSLSYRALNGEGSDWAAADWTPVPVRTRFAELLGMVETPNRASYLFVRTAGGAVWWLYRGQASDALAVADGDSEIEDDPNFNPRTGRCIDGYIRSGNSCIPHCPVGFAYNADTGT